MQWNCPHCGTNLGLADQQLGSGWSFSKCYKCSGFALIRRAEINVIKVDKAPPGEPILLPEASAHPSIGILSEKEAKKLEEALWKTPVNANRSNPTLSKKSLFGATESFAQAGASTNPLSGESNNGLSPIMQLEAMTHSKGKKDKKDLRFSPAESAGSFWQSNKLSASVVTVSSLLFVAGLAAYLDAEDFWTQKKPPSKSSPTGGKKVMAAHHKNQYLFKVTPRNKLTEIRSGPGTEHPVILKTDPNSQFLVSEWRDKWFNIINHDTHQHVGWILNDDVKTEAF
jgi:hypothetical protein